MAAPLDLNLIRAFVAIYETGNVTAAGERLNLSQPSVSYALSKLRLSLQDPLFSRNRQGMAPTPRAQRLYDEFLTALRRIDHVVDEVRAFDPARSNRRFVIGLSDIGEMVFLPPILERLRAVAPDIELQVRQTSTDELRRGLTTGVIAAAVGNLPMLTDMQSVSLFEENYVCLLSHDAAMEVPLTLDVFRQARHVHVASVATGHLQIGGWLKKAGIERHIMLEIPHFAILPSVIASSDLVALVPSRVGSLFERYAAVKTTPVPAAIPSFEVRLYWHENDETNVAQNWLRKLMINALLKS
ncbi:LysR family transcriptional regulator [Sphingomonas sp. NFX23]|uniref:LysR family transcriptional regulator n=1 Tax=Sphingomonas sp. NFX23 TaxID=2819532 RepID=UPI003CEBD421